MSTSFEKQRTSPSLLAAIGDVARPSWRASSEGVNRLWCDHCRGCRRHIWGGVADLGQPGDFACVGCYRFRADAGGINEECLGL